MLDTQCEFCVHMIQMDESKKDPLIRIFWVSTSGNGLVFEGIKNWSQCSYWICSITPAFDVLSYKKLRNSLRHNQYVAMQGIIASTEYIESLGMDRVDSGQ